MKIIQLVTKRQYRGAEVFASELSNMLGKKGHEIYFIGLYTPPENVLYASHSTNIDLNGRKRFVNFSLLFKLINTIRKIQPDVIQANGSDTLKYAVLAKKLFPRVKIAYRNISMVSSWTSGQSFKKKFNQWLFNHVDIVTSVSQESLNDLVKTYHYPIDQAKLIRRGIPEIYFEPSITRKRLLKEFPIDENDFILLHVGQFSLEKNHPFLIEVFEYILKRIKNVKLIFVGEGVGESKIRALVEQKNLNNRVILAGYKSNIQEILSGSDLFILGSTIEGLPGVILEAAMQSKPSVAVDVGGVGEILLNRKTGILIPTHAIGEFGDAVIELLLNHELRKKMGDNAYLYVKENFGLERSAEQFEALYKSLLN